MTIFEIIDDIATKADLAPTKEMRLGIYALGLAALHNKALEMESDFKELSPAPLWLWAKFYSRSPARITEALERGAVGQLKELADG